MGVGMSSLTNVLPRRVLGAFVAAFLLTCGLSVAGGGGAAHADTAPAAGTLPTVSADALPTWQINGVVWQQIVIGNTVYAVGSFTKARPPGVGAGGAGEVAAANIFAYDLTTGNRVASFSHQLNGQALGITKSPDGSRIYIGGDFTTVDGITHNHIAAFNTATGALDNSFTASVSGQVRAVSATSSVVYVGGSFGTVGGKSRSNLAAVSATTGAVQTWAPTADGVVWSMVLAPSGANVVVGGTFLNLTGTAASGLGSIDASTGATLPFAANQSIQNGGSKSAIVSLKTDGSQIYGTGYAFGTGNFEGTFAANPTTGAITLVNDCHGDTYDSQPIGGVLYSVSHTHDCTWIGSYPDTNPRIRWQKALAMTIAPATTNSGPDSYGWNYNGLPASAVLQWFPNFSFGSYTSSGQAGWSLTGNSDYLAVGGEFPSVNGTAQQGLVRFARTGLAPNKVGPSYTTVPSRSIPPTTALSLAAGTARVSFGTAWDYDNEELTYDVLRDNTTWVNTSKIKTNFWTLPTSGFIDTGLTPGSQHYYQVRITDSFGNAVWSPKSNTVTISSNGGATSAYSSDVTGDGASHYWRLGESSGATAYDYAGFDDDTLSGGYTRGTSGAISGDADKSTTFDGNNAYAVNSSAVKGPDVFSEEVWFRTTTTSGGKIVGFGDNATGTSSNYDRHIYMDTSGRLWFGVYNNGSYTVNTNNALNDGQWHHAVGTMGPTGLTFYVDGKKVGTNGGTSVAQPYTGYWRIGGDSPWSGNAYFQGDIDDVAIYPSVLTLTQVQKHYTDSGRDLGLMPVPTDTYGKAVYNDHPDLYFRVGESTGTVARDSSGNGADGIYSGGVTLGQPGAVSGTSNTAVSLNGSDGAVAAGSPVNNPTTYSEELWFNTTTNRGGKLIGFGSNQTGGSGGYDRHVYMFDDGRLRFGVWTGQTNVIDTDRSYNDGAWHYVVATQSSDGMKLYVDGVLVGTNPQTQAQDYTGYWRLGGDNTWGGNSSNYFAGTLDEAAVYSTALSADQVKAHYLAGGGELANQPPTAAFSSSTSFLTASFDSSASSDPEGKALTYAWDFGDGGTSTDANPDHTYGSAGVKHVTLVVTDNKGATDTVSHDVTVTANQAPTAAFTATPTNLAVAFDGSGSSDPEGKTLTYAWDFGDGDTSTAAKPNHTYASAGVKHVTLTVSDPQGGIDAVSHDVTVTEAPNQPPTAAFSSSTSFLTASFDSSASSDPEGKALTYAWDFGDGGTSTDANPDHTYGSAGVKHVTLVVTDNKGATDTVSHDVTVTANQAPTAAFTATPTNLAVAFDGSGSSDPEGKTLTYAWDFGDGDTSTAAKPNHTYASAGVKHVTLTVSDPQGGIDSVSHDVTVTSVVTVAADDFGRTAATGWGSADKGGAWTVNSTARTSVSGGVGNLTMAAAGNTTSAFLQGVSVRDTDLQTQLSLSSLPVGGNNGVYLSFVERRVVGTGDYRAKVRILPGGAVRANLVRTDSAGTETVITAEAAVSGLTYNTGDVLQVRMQATGSNPTTLRLKVWKSGSTEPTAWQITGTDSTAGLQSASGVGLLAYLSGSTTNPPITAKFDGLRVYDASTL